MPDERPCPAKFSSIDDVACELPRGHDGQHLAHIGKAELRWSDWRTDQRSG